MSNVINSSSLFHFTKEMDSLKGILKNGFRFSYCLENVLNDTNKGVAIPMICFCDIPLMNVQKHRDKYGNYAIGFSKDLRGICLSIAGLEINPVFYIDALSIKNTVKYFHNQMLSIEKDKTDAAFSYVNKIRENKSSIDTEELDNWLKPIVHAKSNTTKLLGFIKAYENEGKCFYDEREWRIILQNLTDHKWYWDISNTEFIEKRKEYNQKLHGTPKSYLANDIMSLIIESFITHIIVNSEQDIVDVVEYIMSSRKLFGCKIDPQQKRILISKITSFERISKDY